MSDLTRDPESPLPESAASAGGEDELVFARGRVRALGPARPTAPGHVFVEPVEPVASLLEADAELLAELLEAVKRVARDVVEQHGACRVVADVGNGAERLRWHVHARKG